MHFDQLVEELSGALVQVSKLAALVLVELNTGMSHQHFANEQSRLGVIHLPSVISRLNEPFSAVHVNSRSGPTERAEEAASQQWRKPFSKTGAVIVHFFNPTLLARLAIFRLVSTFDTVPLFR